MDTSIKTKHTIKLKIVGFLIIASLLITPLLVFQPMLVGSIQAGFPVLSRSGNTSGYVNFTGSLSGTGNICLDGSGNATVSGCAGGTGTVNTGTAHQIGYYAANGTAISGNAATLDSSGNYSSPGTVTTGSGGGSNGAIDLIDSISSFFVTLTTGTLTANRNVIAPDVTGTLGVRDTSFSNGDCVKYVGGLFTSFGAACGGGGGGSTISFGTYASLPGTCTTNSLYYATDSYYSFLCTASNVQSPFLDGKQLVLPTAASTWTLVNGSGGTATKTDSKGAVLLSTTSDVAGVEAILKATPVAPYVKTILVSAWAIDGQAPGGSDGIRCGVLWSNGTTTANSIQIMSYLGLGTPTTLYLQIAHFTSFAYAGQTTDYLGANPLMMNTSRLWMQLEDNNTNRFFRVSNDGINWNTLFSVARTSPFTPTNYGVFCGQQGGTGTAIGQPFSAAILSDN